ncbi:AI-2E family transporter [Alcaligenaceae bacterium CGII-47]|nr:AI-2E family transporter [Alcaligenaceae bacterium CGII-47]
MVEDLRVPSEEIGTVIKPHRMDASSLALTVLALLAFTFALQWARSFFIPLVFGVLITYTLNPVVIWLTRVMPRILGVCLVMLALVLSTVGITTSIYNEVQVIMEQAPTAAYKLTQALKRSNNGELNVLDRVHNAADALKSATNTAPRDADTKAEKAPTFNINDWLWSGALGTLGFFGQLTMVLFLVFFLLLSGDTFKRKLVKLTGPSLSHKKVTVHILDDINTTIQRYMFMLLVTNILLALLTWLVLHWIGLANPGAWAVASALLHIIPYFGPVAAATGMGLAAFLQFGSFAMMFLVSGVFLVLASIIGMLVTTWMTGRIAKMNPSAVFVALLFGQWLWGVWGMLLCVPIVMVIKVISERIEGMQPIAELLGE